MVSVSGSSVVETISRLISAWSFWATFPYAEKCLDIRQGGVVDRVKREVEMSSVGVRPFFFPLMAHKLGIFKEFDLCG